MKTKKFDKKLMLNKNTIAHLNNNEMNGAQGGTAETFVYCETGLTYCRTKCATYCPMCPSDYTACPYCL